MMAMDEDAVICDFAETYGIYDIQSLPVSTRATLAAGLRDDSRIKQEITQKYTKETPLGTDTILLAQGVDLLSLLLWSRTKDGQKGRNKPKSILNALLGADKKDKQKDEDKPLAFDSPEDFEKMWKKMGGGGVGKRN